jgi:MFS family permease
MVTLSISVLLLSFHFAFVYFINSTFLTKFVDEDGVGFLYTLGALLNIGLFLLMPRLLRSKGNFKLLIYLTILEAVAMLGMAFSIWPILSMVLFIVHFALPPLLIYCLDIFLENETSRTAVGSVRGVYLTLVNIPYVVTPFIVGLILTTPDYWKIYLISASFLVPFIILIFSNFRKFKDPVYPVVEHREIVSSFYHNKNLFDIFLDNFLLQLFYGWMVIYMPIYLRDHLGFAWSEIGLMFSIMLLPFILFQIPVGRLEDTKHDEKQILIMGFCIMAGAVLLIPFINEPNFVLWTAILFVSRIGASMVEVSCESYFFKHITPDNATYISFFRMTRSLPLLISPAIVGISFYLFGFTYSFIVLGAIMLLGARYAFQITDK